MIIGSVRWRPYFDVVRKHVRRKSWDRAQVRVLEQRGVSATQDFVQTLMRIGAHMEYHLAVG